MMILVELLLLACIFIQTVISQTLTIQTLTQPSGCRGGEICDVQPSVVVTNKQTQQIDFFFSGDVYVQIGTSPTGYESLYIGQTCDLSSCGQKVTGTLATATFVNGIATFQNLHIAEAGVGYTLRFIGRQANGDLFADTFSDLFDVTVGDAYKLALQTFIGTAFGGEPFAANPVVAVVDRGSNVVPVTTATTTTTATGSVIAKPWHVQAVITASPHTTDPVMLAELLQPASATTVDIAVNGLATFEGLYINQSGLHYQMTFTTNMPDLASDTLVSTSFDVTTGTPAKIEFVPGFEPAFSAKYSGEFFAVCPRLRLLDVGGNFVSFDNTSALRVSIRHDPTGRAQIGPESNTFVAAQQGVVTFRALNIDKAGLNYTLLFSLFNFSALGQGYFPTHVSLTSEKFHVLPGPPRRLVVTQRASGAWAGNQAFSQQPVVEVQDYGGNRIQSDFASNLTATVLPSLSVVEGPEENLLIDTAGAPMTQIADIRFNVGNDSYGTGQVIDVIVSYPYNVWVQDTGSVSIQNFTAATPPYLKLNIANAFAGTTTAAASLVGSSQQTKSLVFRYVVVTGDSTGGNELDYVDSTALVLNGTEIVDGNRQVVNTSLPVPSLLTANQSVYVDTDSPVVISMSANITDGEEYGAGQVIAVDVTFNHPVVVMGQTQALPFLVFAASNSSLVTSFNDTSNVTTTLSNTSYNALAVYSHSSVDDTVLTFIYTVRELDFPAAQGPQNLTLLSTAIEFANITHNATHVSYYNGTAVLLNATMGLLNTPNNTALLANLSSSINNGSFYVYDFEYSNEIEGSIRRRSNIPTTLADYSLGGVGVAFQNAYAGVVIDTTPPALLGSYALRTGHEDGTYYPGEHIYLTVRFDKPVVVSGVGIYLRLDAGPHGQMQVAAHGEITRENYIGFAYINRLWSDNVTLEFLYIVEEYVNTSALAIEKDNAIVVPAATATLARKATHPTTPASLFTHDVYNSTTALRKTSAIALNGYSPTVVGVGVESTDPVAASTLYADDTVLIQVNFSAPVVTLCSPVLVMLHRYYREAEYVSGNMSDTLYFRYTVAVGDYSDAIQYRHTPYALCSTSGCPYRTDCQILANSSSPRLPVNLRLERSDSASPYSGVSIGSQKVRPFSPTRNTSVSSIECQQPAGEYGAGSVLRFVVTFTDIISLDNTTSSVALPRLYLNVGKYAEYSSGNHGLELIFTYITTSNDTLTDEDLAPVLIPGTSSALDCDAVANGCGVTNQAYQSVDLNTSASITTFVATGIRLDPTPPVVMDIFTTKQTSPYEGGEYALGEEILVFVNVSKPVIVTGFDPRVEMNLTHPDRFALYSDNLSTDTLLVFVYTVREGDFSSDVHYLRPYLDLFGSNSRIYRASDIPTTLMDTALPDPSLSTSLAQNGHVVRVNSRITPRVVNVTTLLPTFTSTFTAQYDTLYVGDSVIIRVDFDREVIVEGHSYITVNVGDHIRKAAFAGYFPGSLQDSNVTANVSTTDALNFTAPTMKTPSSMTRHLFYRYVVEAGDFTEDLDYTDVYALQPGLTDNNDPGYISHAASHALALSTADLMLPQPGAPGSLRGDRNVVRVDGRAPYVRSLFFLTSPGVYSTNATILIAMNFSAPVYVTESDGGSSHSGSDNGYSVPSIKLETGYVDQHAVYIEGSGTTQLVFKYQPEPGDASTDLDYHSERSAFSSAAASFHYNGCRILALSANPGLDAQIWLNPPNGALSNHRTESVVEGERGGTIHAIAEAGEFRYENLHIDWRGPDYQLRFSTVPAVTGSSLDLLSSDTSTVLTTTQEPLSVSFSSERQLRPENAFRGHQVGRAVDIDGDIAVVGCPNCNNSVTTIQAIVTSAAEGGITREVQTLQTTVTPQPAIQVFYTTGDVDSTIDGGFTISHDGFGPTALIPANANYLMVESIIRFDLPSLGNVSVLREPYIFCSCQNAFTWTITFLDQVEGSFSPLTLDGSSLTGAGAQIVGPSILQSPALLGGTFTLSALGLTTSAIPIDAGVLEISTAVAELGLSVYDVFISPTEKTLARTWSITFDAYLDSYEMPLLEPDAALVTGGEEVKVFVQRTLPGRHGPEGIAGFFALEWRGNTTRPLPANATAAQMKTALEELPAINYVNVNRSEDTVLYGYTWTVEMVSVNQHSARGLVLQPTSNLEPFTPVNNLIATDPVIDVEAIYALGSRNQIFGSARQGTFGAGAGAVHIYQRRNETWDEMATIRGNDTVENNRFGGSVSLVGDVLLVGAVGANMNGVPEKQGIFCSLSRQTGGEEAEQFVIKFRGWQTDPISTNVTREELLDAILSDPRFFTNLYTVRAIDIDDWGGGALCDNNTAVITFYSPVDGAELLLGEDTGPDLELLEIEIVAADDNSTTTSSASSGSAASFTVNEVQKGTWRLHNLNSDPQQLGAAYVFRAVHECGDATDPRCRKSNWTQEAQLFATTSVVGSRFGYSVALGTNVAVIGAPGSFNEKGAFYVYEYDTGTQRWEYLQVTTFPTIEEGDHFGSTVVISGDTIIIGAPEFMNSTGGAFVYTRPASGGAFIASESLVPTPTLYPQNPGDLFGTGITVEGDVVIVGAPGYDDQSVHFGDTGSPTARTQAGAAFVFERVSSFFNFKFLQRLEPSNVQEFDHFGRSMDLNGRNLVVTSLQEYIGDWLPDKPVAEVKTYADYSQDPLGGTFKLTWMKTLEGGTFTTRSIWYDTSAALLREILEEDFPAIGPLKVRRSRVDAYDGGYAWSITFLDYNGNDGDVTLFDSDTTLLAGTNAGVQVTLVTPTPPSLRGKTHVFQRADANSLFVEQMLLSPYVHQKMDRCGEMARISGKYAIVGCPNRDQFVPSQNSGAAFMYHLGLLATEFASKFTVLEGNDAAVTMQHDAANIQEVEEDLYFYLQSIDRNAFSHRQKFIQHLFGVQSSATTTYPDSILDRTLLVGKANARSQFYGSAHRESPWVDGMYDYRAISDYVPHNQPHVFLREDVDGVLDTIVTTDDSIYETPDEYIVIGMTSPGVWPSVFGRIHGQIRIYDPADGNLWGEPRYRKLYDTLDVSQEGISATTSAASIISNAPNPRSPAETESRFGAAVAVNEALGVMMVGAPLATVDDRAEAGKVVFYRRDSGGNWTTQSTFFSSPSPTSNGHYYGSSVVVNRIYERNLSLLAVTELSLNRVYVYASEGSDVGESYTLDATFSPDHSFNDSTVITQNRFGELGSVALHGFLLVIAAPGLETAWAYRRVFDAASQSWTWSPATLIRSTDYDYDVIRGVVHLHTQDFGKSVAVNDRTVLVGAPFADYDTLGEVDKFGVNLIETEYDTEGTSIRSFGRGKAYVFYSAPASQEVRILSPTQLRFGTFQLTYDHHGVNATTELLSYNIDANSMANALMKLPNIDHVQVTASFSELSNGYEYSWQITFLSDWEDSLDLLQPEWYNFGCNNCTEFSTFVDRNDSLTNSSDIIQAFLVTESTELSQVQMLSAQDRRNGDRFGWSVAIDGDQIAVGAPFSAAMTSTSWDFEAGTLLGWRKTGDAFDYQPTFGDNSYLRGGNAGRQGSKLLRRQTQAAVGMEGRYYIGTYEKRPGDAANFRTYDNKYPEGNIQGDAPRGTLSSDVFIIRGNSISFSVGGGCDIYTEFVELLVDGLSVGKQTGQCRETMRPVSFDVTLFQNRAAQIRIVDNSTANWGHINVDNFKFDWDVQGATFTGENSRTTAGGTTETPQAGAVYLFRRNENTTSLNASSEADSMQLLFAKKCATADKRSCAWTEETRFSASDKRANMQLGSAVAVLDAPGILLVGAPHAVARGFYKEIPSVFPYYDTSYFSPSTLDASTIAQLPFPVASSNMGLLQSHPEFVPERSGADAIWQLMEDTRNNALDSPSKLGKEEPRVYENAGAVYTFVKSHEKLSADGFIVEPQFWRPMEQAKLQPPDVSANDNFGAAFFLDGMSVAVGSAGNDGLLVDAGAAYIYNVEYASLSFSAIEYHILEGADKGVVAVTLLRDLDVYAGAMVVEVATSDLSARGVDPHHFAACQQMPVRDRSRALCGDYEQTRATVVIPAGDSSGGFTVKIMDDLCHERFMEYIQLTVSVPGAASLQSERLSAKIRVDDNDYGFDEYC